MRVEFDADGLTFREYPFSSASIGRGGRIARGDIRDVGLNAWPPEVRTRAGETLFVSAEQRDELIAWSTEFRVPVVERVDVWSLLLEPFLDTEFDVVHTRRTMAQLAAAGISERETGEIRRTVERPMLAYNAAQWEWNHLGLYDLLHAVRGGIHWLSIQHTFSPRQFAEFYMWAMEIADRGRRDGESAGESAGDLPRVSDRP